MPEDDELKKPDEVKFSLSDIPPELQAKIARETRKAVAEIVERTKDDAGPEEMKRAYESDGSGQSPYHE